MKIAYIIGSPKAEKSASEHLLREIQGRCGAHEAVWLKAGRKPVAEDMQAGAGCDALVFAFPLYVDGIMSFLLQWLVEAEPLVKDACPGSTVYAVANCGFFEARQNRLTLQMMRQWCERAGLRWGRGLGIGGGGMATSMKLGTGMLRDCGAAVDALAMDISALSTGEDAFAEVNCPRQLYIVGGNRNWVAEGKRNGLTRKDLYRRLELDTE